MLKQKIIVACSHIETLELLLDCVQRAIDKVGLDADAYICASLQELRMIRRHRRSGDVELLVVHTDIDESREVRGTTGQLGFEYLCETQRSDIPTTSVLVCEDASRELLVKMMNFELIKLLLIDLNTDYVSYFEKILQTAFGKRSQPVSSPPVALIDFKVPFDTKRSTVTMCTFHTDNNISDQRAVPINRKKVQLLVDKSRRLRTGLSQALIDKMTWDDYLDKWHEDYRIIGQLVFELVATKDFDDLYKSACEYVGNKGVRVRFTLHENYYDGLRATILSSTRYRLSL